MGVDASLLGAAELAFEPLLADPATWSGGATPYRTSSRPSEELDAPNRRETVWNLLGGGC